jgi:hypothetical protein
MNAHSAASLSATNKAGRVKQFRAGRSLNKVSAAHVTKSPVIKASITATIKKNGSRHGLRAASKMILKATSR